VLLLSQNAPERHGNQAERLLNALTRSEAFRPVLTTFTPVQTMNQSLHSFCKFNGLSKGSVHSYLTGQGFDLSQGMTADAIAAAREQFIDEPPAPADDIPTSPTTVLPPGAGYADPFTGVATGGAMVPAGFQAQNRALATTAAAKRVQQICMGANLHSQQTVTAALESGDQMGQQLGAFLAERTIAAAETQRQQLIAEYLKSQGVETAPKSNGGPAA
jgi:hypothetical protein